MNNILFLMWNCPDCVKIKNKIKPEAMLQDGFEGKDGQKLSVFYTFTNTATRDLLDHFGLRHNYVPCLMTSFGAILDNVDGILDYLKAHDFCV